jgi:hypothetical protein
LRERIILFGSVAVTGIIFMLVKFPGNESFKNDIASPFSGFCLFSFSVIVKKKLLKALATIVGSVNFSLFTSKEGACSTGYPFTVSFFIMFHVVLILLLDFAITLP